MVHAALLHGCAHTVGVRPMCAKILDLIGEVFIEIELHENDQFWHACIKLHIFDMSTKIENFQTQTWCK